MKSIDNDPGYVVLKFDIRKNLLIIGGLVRHVEFVQKILNMIDNKNNSDPYYPQNHVVRFNLGINLPKFLKSIDKLKHNDSIEITRINKINRLI